jgi:hypothetical protein
MSTMGDPESVVRPYYCPILLSVHYFLKPSNQLRGDASWSHPTHITIAH